MGDYYGLPIETLANDFVTVEYLATAGPRLVRLFLHTAPAAGNLLAEAPGVHWSTPYGDYHTRGGHRLWHAPEAMPRTYVPDDAGLEACATPEGVALYQPVEAATGLSKCLSVRLHPQQAALTLNHRIGNHGLWPVELSPWAITQMPLGGLVILPQPTPPCEHALLPDRHLVAWPYTRWTDPRLELRDDYCLLHAAAALPPCKLGYFNSHGWAGYLRAGALFVKRFQPRPGRPHPDLGCNVETYCNDEYVELETLGPLSRLEPGQVAIHVETWELYAPVEAPEDPAELQAWLAGLSPGLSRPGPRPAARMN
jgi:hypothetical protein